MRVSRSTLPALLLVLSFPACDDKDAVEGKGAEAAGKAKGGAKAGSDGAAASSLKAIRVAAGNSAACALMDDGTARCWGRNDVGEHGIESSQIDAATPVAIPGVRDGVDIWMGGDSGSSGDMACVRTKTGAISCWGSKRNKPLTDGKTWTNAAEEIEALKGAKDLALGGGTQYAIMPDGSVNAWGGGAFNSFGDGVEGSRDRGLTKVPGVANAKALAAGQNHACALLDDGTVTCWGYVTPKQAPKKIEGLSGVVAIGAGSGGSDTCAVMTNKTVQCWSAQQEPREESELADVTLVRARNHKCALAGDGQVRCWGSNSRGQAGIGEVGGSNGKKVPVVDLGKAVHMDVGGNFVCAALEDGNAKCWGWNKRGQLGNGTLLDSARPTPVAGLTAASLAPAADGADKAPQADVDMDWSGLPAACTKPTKIEASNKYLAGDFNVISAYATRKSDGKYVNVSLATYKMEPKRPKQSPRGKQFQLGLKFGRVNLESKEAFAVDVGDYVFGLKNERKVSTSVRHKAGSSTLMKLSLAGASPGTVSIAHIGDTWVCGALDLKTKNSSFTGPWAARIVK